MTRVADLRSDYDRLGALLAEADGSGAAAIARERRIIGELLEQLERPHVKPKLDQVAEQRAKSQTARAPARRRQSGRGA